MPGILDLSNAAISANTARFAKDLVALTRAKDGLYLSYPMMSPKSYSGDVYCRPSQFLEDFPAELVEEWKVGNSDPWSDDGPF